MASKMRMFYPYPKGRSFQNEDRVTFKIAKEFRLRDKVINQKQYKMTPCLSEMSILMSCLKESRFDEKECLNELKEFQDCCSNTVAAAREVESSALASGVQAKHTKNNTAEINKLFEKYKK